MIVDYKAFIDRLIQNYEGGYGWDSADPGGPTKYGITCYDLAAHRGQRMTSKLTWAPIVKAMTLSEAEDIYRTKYAAAVDFDDLPAGVDCCWLDYAVNSGVGRPIRVAQAFLGVGVDGVLGPKTLAAVNAYGAQRFVTKMCDERMRFLRGLRIWRTFSKGWTARVNDLRWYCNRLINAQPIVAPASLIIADPTEMAKAYVTSIWSRIDYRLGNTATPFIERPVLDAPAPAFFGGGGMDVGTGYPAGPSDDGLPPS